MVHQSAKKNDDAAPTDSPECAALTMDAASDEDDLSEVTRTGGVDLQRQAVFFFVSSPRQYQNGAHFAC